MKFWLPALAVALGACGSPDIDWSYETPVEAKTPAGDFRGVTGVVERFTPDTELVSVREVEVWLPASYATEPERRYPVLYMHDGQNLFNPEPSEYSGWDWGVDEAMTALGQERGLEAIVVGVHSDAATRFGDYFPQGAGEVRALRSDIAEHGTGELNADNYLRFLVEEVKPRIDAQYRTLAGRDDTFVMGSSMGGLISLYAVSAYPEVFGGAGMVSTHFPLGDGALVEWFAQRLPDPATHRLYFDYGTETLDHNYQGYQSRMDRAVEAAGYRRGVNWTTRKWEGHDHSERAWRNRVHVPLSFLLAGENVAGGEER